MHSAFLSHSWTDKALARRLAEILRELGCQVWLDEAEIKLGDSLIEKIRSGIDTVDYVVALISKSSVRSGWVAKELDIAMNQEIEGKKVKVLPILAEKCDLPGFLKGKLYADMSTPAALKKSLPLLLDRLGAAPDIVRRFEGKKIKSTKADAWLGDFNESLDKNDLPGQYRAIQKARKASSIKNTANQLKVLDGLFQLSSSEQPAHVRIAAIQLIGTWGQIGCSTFFL